MVNSRIRSNTYVQLITTFFLFEVWSWPLFQANFLHKSIVELAQVGKTVRWKVVAIHTHTHTQTFANFCRNIIPKKIKFIHWALLLLGCGWCKMPAVQYSWQQNISDVKLASSFFSWLITSKKMRAGLRSWGQRWTWQLTLVSTENLNRSLHDIFSNLGNSKQSVSFVFFNCVLKNRKGVLFHHMSPWTDGKIRKRWKETLSLAFDIFSLFSLEQDVATERIICVRTAEMTQYDWRLDKAQSMNLIWKCLL